MRWSSLAIAALFCGCGLSAFDDRRDEAWSDSSGIPSGVASSDYAAAVDSVSTELSGARIVALGLSPPALATLEYDEAGDLRAAGVGLDITPLDPPVLAGARDVVTGVTGLVAVAIEGAIALFDVRDGGLGPELVGTIELADCGLDASAAVADMAIALTDAGDLEAPELIAVAGSVVIVAVDLEPGGDLVCERCSLGAGATGLAVASIDIGDPEGDELLVAAETGGSAALVGLSAAAIAAGSGACPDPLVSIDAPGGEADFGAHLVAGDLDGDDVADLATTAAGGSVVYAIRQVEIGGEPFVVNPLAAIGNSGEFGADLEMVDLDGDEGDEIVVGDPGADVEGVEAAGSAVIFSAPDNEAPDVAAIIFDSTPVAGQRFGRSLSLAEFVAPPEDTDLLIVGASGEVFTYFRSLFGGEDPR